MRPYHALTVYRPENVPAFIEAVKRREKVLSGFGHRVYKTVSLQAALFCFRSDEKGLLPVRSAVLHCSSDGG